MKTPTLKILACLALALCCGPTRATAEAPSGTLSYHFDAASGMQLWNFGGVYSSALSFYPDDQLELHQDAKGRVSASFASRKSDTAALFGAIKVSRGQITLPLASRGTVLEYYSTETESYFVKRKDKLSLTFDPAEQTLFGIDRETRTREELIYWDPGSFWEGSHQQLVRVTTVLKRPVELRAPETTDGKWTLEMNLMPAKNKLSGTATVTFSNGDKVRFLVQGTYSPRTGKSKIVLKGDLQDKGATLLLSIVGPDLALEWMRGSVCGQRIQVP